MKLMTATMTAAILISMSGCTSKSRTDDRAALNELQQRLVDAFKARDLDRIMSRYVPDDSLLVFDVAVPRQYKGYAAYRKDFSDLLTDFPGKTTAELMESYVDASGDLGYGHAIVHYTVTAKDGSVLDLTARLTDVFRRMNGQWLVEHEHVSWPVEFPSGKADLQSKP